MNIDTDKALEWLDRLRDGVENSNHAAEQAVTAAMKAVSTIDELERRRWFMDSRGYRPCNIPACNCPYWHGGHAERRLEEIDDLLRYSDKRTNGVTLIDDIRSLLPGTSAA